MPPVNGLNSCAKLFPISVGWRYWPTRAILWPGARPSRFGRRPTRSASRSRPPDVRRADDIAPAFAALDSQADALYVVGDPISVTNMLTNSALALKARLPDMHGVREAVLAGGLMSYGANLSDLFRRAAELVDRILRGEKPADIPVEQPTKFDLVINLKTAKALGVAVPHNLLVLADEVIE